MAHQALLMPGYTVAKMSAAPGTRGVVYESGVALYEFQKARSIVLILTNIFCLAKLFCISFLLRHISNNPVKSNN